MRLRLKTAIIFIALALLVFSGFMNYKFYKLNRKYTKALPIFLLGESIDYLDLISADENHPDLNGLSPDKPVLIYIFPRISCLSCDKNIDYLKKFSNILGGAEN